LNFSSCLVSEFFLLICFQRQPPSATTCLVVGFGSEGLSSTYSSPSSLVKASSLVIKWFFSLEVSYAKTSVEGISIAPIDIDVINIIPNLKIFFFINKTLFLFFMT